MNDKMRHVVVEGWLYWYNGFAGGMLTYLATEESYKYMSPVFRFWLIAVLGSSIAGFNGLKAFRSMTYGRAYGSPEPETPLPPVLPKQQPSPQPKQQ